MKLHGPGQSKPRPLSFGVRKMKVGKLLAALSVMVFGFGVIAAATWFGLPDWRVPDWVIKTAVSAYFGWLVLSLAWAIWAEE
jgi:hypothetical protein